jgi:hypothetical protein
VHTNFAVFTLFLWNYLATIRFVFGEGDFFSGTPSEIIAQRTNATVAPLLTLAQYDAITATLPVLNSKTLSWVGFIYLASSSAGIIATFGVSLFVVMYNWLGVASRVNSAWSLGESSPHPRSAERDCSPEMAGGSLPVEYTDDNAPSRQIRKLCCCCCLGCCSLDDGIGGFNGGQPEIEERMPRVSINGPRFCYPIGTLPVFDQACLAEMEHGPAIRGKPHVLINRLSYLFIATCTVIDFAVFVDITASPGDSFGYSKVGTLGLLQGVCILVGLVLTILPPRKRYQHLVQSFLERHYY